MNEIKEVQKQHQRDFTAISGLVKSRIKFLDTLNYDKDILAHKKDELSIVLKSINKVRETRLKPFKELTTVRGQTFKIGDKFKLPGDEVSKWEIVLFPDEVTIRGVANNPAIGKPWVCEVYLESAILVENEKPIKEKKRKVKKVKLKVGDYFALTSNNTIYKATSVTKKKVQGKNELKKNNLIGFNPKKTEVRIKSKKDYKKQLKAERRFSQ